jgi:hypothetical protein
MHNSATTATTTNTEFAELAATTMRIPAAAC